MALFVAAIVIARLTAHQLGPMALLLAAFTAAVAGWAVLATLRGGHFSAVSPRESAFDSLLRDGILPAALSTVGILLCLVELVAILTVSWG